MKRQIFLIPLLLACLGGSVFGAETLVIPGSGSNEVLLRDLAAVFNSQHPGQEVIIPPSVGSVGGIHLVGTDQALLGRVTRPPEGGEKSFGLSYLVFARDPVVFAVGTNVKIKSLTSDQLLNIFSGKITNWQEVGGSPAIIRVLVRQPGETSLRIIQECLKQFQDITFSAQSKIMYHDYEMVEMLQKYKNSISWLTASSVSGTSIQPIAVDNIEPSLKNTLACTYKLVVDSALVYKEKSLNKMSSSFIEYLFSEKGKKVIEAHGVIPVARD